MGGGDGSCGKTGKGEDVLRPEWAEAHRLAELAAGAASLIELWRALREASATEAEAAAILAAIVRGGREEGGDA